MKILQIYLTYDSTTGAFDTSQSSGGENIQLLKQQLSPQEQHFIKQKVKAYLKQFIAMWGDPDGNLKK
jgi:hypothetical protein